jgi:hypothetical protein
MKMEQSVPKRRYITFRRREINQMYEYNKLILPQQYEKFPSFYEHRRFITVFTTSVPVLCQNNRVHALPKGLLRIHFNITFLSMPRSSKWSLSLPHQNLVCTSLPHPKRAMTTTIIIIIIIIVIRSFN